MSWWTIPRGCCRTRTSQAWSAWWRISTGLRPNSRPLPHPPANIDTMVDELRSIIRDAHRVITDLQAATQNAGVDFVAAIQKLRATSDNLERASGSLDAFVAENRDQLRRF